jgi:hypothetical protein
MNNSIIGSLILSFIGLMFSLVLTIAITGTVKITLILGIFALVIGVSLLVR